MVLAAIGVGDKLFAAILEPAHRMAASHGEPREADFLAGDDRLVAEAAADVGRDHADLELRDLQRIRKAGAHHMGELRCAMEHKLAIAGVPLSDEAAALDRRHDLARGAQRARHLDVGGGGSLFDVPVKSGLEEGVALDGVVHLRRAGLDRFQHIDHRRKLFIFDADLRCDVLGLGARVGDTERDQFADMAKLVDREHRLLRSLKSRQRRHGPDRSHAGKVLRRKHRGAKCFRDAHAEQPAVGHGAPHERHLAHAGKRNIADVLSTTAKETVVFLAGKSRPDAVALPALR